MLDSHSQDIFPNKTIDKSQALLTMVDISKSFPGVKALKGVSLDLKRGEVLGLVGENGAGKSTLMKILSGVYVMDEGQILIGGNAEEIKEPQKAQQLGISIIYQEFNLMPNMSVRENIFLGREPSKLGFVKSKELGKRVQNLLEQLNVSISLDSLVKNLSVAEQQLVEIAKALSQEVQIMVMDEPTSALSETEVQALFNVIQDLKRRNIGIIFISHRLNEICKICDRITVLRDGENVGTFDIDEVDEDRIINLMVGRSLDEFFAQNQDYEHEVPVRDIGLARSDPQVVLEVKELSRLKRTSTGVNLDNISFKLKRGEILGLAGLVGSGRTEVVRAIFGVDNIQKGEIFVDETRVDIHSPIDAIKLGIGLVPEDRKLQGLILSMGVHANTTLSSLDELCRYGFINFSEEKRVVEELIKSLRIKTPTINQIVRYLSGGNQQKVVIAKWLMQKPKVLIMDEPTRGIDVGAKAEIHRLIHQLAVDGVSIIIISSDLPELLAMSDRMVCLYEGKISGELDASNANMESVMRYCTSYKEVGIL